jgi:hypothetical protein
METVQGRAMQTTYLVTEKAMALGAWLETQAASNKQKIAHTFLSS